MSSPLPNEHSVDVDGGDDSSSVASTPKPSVVPSDATSDALAEMRSMLQLAMNQVSLLSEKVAQLEVSNTSKDEEISLLKDQLVALDTAAISHNKNVDVDDDDDTTDDMEDASEASSAIFDPYGSMRLKGLYRRPSVPAGFDPNTFGDRSRSRTMSSSTEYAPMTHLDDELDQFNAFSLSSNLPASPSALTRKRRDSVVFSELVGSSDDGVGPSSREMVLQSADFSGVLPLRHQANSADEDDREDSRSDCDDLPSVPHGDHYSRGSSSSDLGASAGSDWTSSGSHISAQSKDIITKKPAPFSFFPDSEGDASSKGSSPPMPFSFMPSSKPTTKFTTGGASIKSPQEIEEYKARARRAYEQAEREESSISASSSPRVPNSPTPSSGGSSRGDSDGVVVIRTSANTQKPFCWIPPDDPAKRKPSAATPLGRTRFTTGAAKGMSLEDIKAYKEKAKRRMMEESSSISDEDEDEEDAGTTAPNAMEAPATAHDSLVAELKKRQLSHSLPEIKASDRNAQSDGGGAAAGGGGGGKAKSPHSAVVKSPRSVEGQLKALHIRGKGKRSATTFQPPRKVDSGVYSFDNDLCVLRHEYRARYNELHHALRTRLSIEAVYMRSSSPSAYRGSIRLGERLRAIDRSTNTTHMYNPLSSFIASNPERYMLVRRRLVWHIMETVSRAGVKPPQGARLPYLVHGTTRVKNPLVNPAIVTPADRLRCRDKLAIQMQSFLTFGKKRLLSSLMESRPAERERSVRKHSRSRSQDASHSKLGSQSRTKRSKKKSRSQRKSRRQRRMRDEIAT